MKRIEPRPDPDTTSNPTYQAEEFEQIDMIRVREDEWAMVNFMQSDLNDANPLCATDLNDAHPLHATDLNDRFLKIRGRLRDQCSADKRPATSLVVGLHQGDDADVPPNQELYRGGGKTNALG